MFAAGHNYDEQILLSAMCLTAQINTNILLILFPLDVQPVTELFPPPLGLLLPSGARDPAQGYSTEEASLPGGAHLLRPERDYPVQRSRLPDGYVLLSRFVVTFPDQLPAGGSSRL